MFCKKGVLRNFTKFTGKHLCHSLWHRCFTVSFVKFLRTPFYTEHLLWQHHQIKLQLLEKVQRWAFGLLVHYINYLQEVLKLKQNFQKISYFQVVTVKTPLSVIGPFCSYH